MKKKALFSLYDQADSVEFAKELIKLGWEIITTTETSVFFSMNGIKSTDIYKFLGVTEKFPFPPTLHPKMELALTTGKWKKIDLVYDNTYPLSSGIDVGGHTLLALAAKGKRIPITDKSDMREFIMHLKKNKNRVKKSTRKILIRKAFMKVSDYYRTVIVGENINEPKAINLMNGENPYQIPSFFFVTDKKDKLSIGNFKQVAGEKPCFTNMADFDNILKIICALSAAYGNKKPYIVVAAKHGNPCGLAINHKSPEKAINDALWGDPLAIWGGEVITNFRINVKLGKKLKADAKRKKIFGIGSWMLDLVAAPGFDKQAIKILSKNPRRKIFKNKTLLKSFPLKAKNVLRQVRGGFLTQPPNNYILDIKDKKFDSLAAAWAASFFSFHGGNEVAIVKNGCLISCGGGPSTVAAAETAIDRAKKSGHGVKGSVFAADAFFPFVDAPRLLVEAGCEKGLVPSGGKNFETVKKYFKGKRVKVHYLDKTIRGFCRH